MPVSPLAAPRELRARWYLQVDKYGKSITEVCAIFGISRKTYYKWRFKDFGPSDHRYQSRKDHPNLKLTPQIKVAIFNAKETYNYGPLKMAYFIRARCGVSLSPTVIYRYYKRRHLIRKPQKKLPWYLPMKEPFASSKPGENVQADVKYVPGEDQTWAYQFRFTDTFTNMQYAVDLLDKSAVSTINAFKRAERSFPFPVTGVQTDNGGEFRGLFALYLKSRGIIHRFIPKRSAPWNGKVERANRSVDDEYYLNVNRPWKNLSAYTRWYNRERPHVGRGMHGMTPYQKFQSFVASSV
jgi:transposase